MADNSTTINGIEAWETRTDGDITYFIRVEGQTDEAETFLDDAAGSISGDNLKEDLEDTDYPLLGRNAWAVFGGYEESYNPNSALEQIGSDTNLNTSVDASYDETEHNANYTDIQDDINALKEIVRSLAGE